jgi:hypothetical protein
MALKFCTFVSYVLGKILVKFHRFIRYFKEVREYVSIISQQPSYREPYHNICNLEMVKIKCGFYNLNTSKHLTCTKSTILSFRHF